jgi:hypothetical protein
LPSDAAPPDNLTNESAEERMRRALNLAASRHSAPGPLKLDHGARPEGRPGERPRQRFVQDGDVPVTIVNRQKHRDIADPAVPSISRASAAESALAAEKMAKLKVERALHEAQNIIHDLQTKQAHADLARKEAADALLASHAQQIAQLQADIAAEREARIAAEASLHDAVIAREQAERELREALAAKPAKPAKPAKAATTDQLTLAVGKPVLAKPVVVKAKRAPRATGPKEKEPQPVKWWIKKPGKR